MTEQNTQPEELDLRSYLRPLLRRKWIILAIVVLAAAGTYFLSSRQQKQYSATTKLYVEVADPTLNITSATVSGSPVNAAVTPNVQAIADVAQLITAQSITTSVKNMLGRPVYTAGTVTSTPVSGTSFVAVSATSHSPVLAAKLANDYVAAFLKSRQQAVASTARKDLRAAKRTLNALTAAGNAALSGKNNTAAANNQSSTEVTQKLVLQQQISAYQQIALNPSPGAQQVDVAAIPSTPGSPTPVRDTIFGALVGLLLGVVVAFCLDLLDRRLVSVETVESIFGRPVLAVLPHVGDPTPIEDGARLSVPAPFLEALRSLTVILRLGADPDTGPPRTILVTSTLPSEGKSTVTRDLALVYAESGQRVLVIDSDLRKPSVQRLFAVNAERGLVHVLQGAASLSDVVVPAAATLDSATVATNGHSTISASSNGDAGHSGSVDILSHGETLSSPLALLASERMVSVLEDAYEAYDIVLIDTPPVLAVADAVPLLEVVDSVLLVARLGQTTRHAAERFKELIGRLSDVNFSGVIANDLRVQMEDEYGSYGYGYGSGSGSGNGRRLRRRKPSHSAS